MLAELVLYRQCDQPMGTKSASIDQQSSVFRSVEATRLAELYGHLEQISTNDDVAVIDIVHLMDHAFWNAWFVQ